jgi:hypothetical protein
MKIGIDASRAFVDNPTGTENYSLRLIDALSRVDKKNTYTLYTKVKSQSSKVKSLKLPPNFHIKTIPLKRFWTQLGLAIECLLNPPDVLFIPAHTLPVIRRPGLKTVITIHDLGSEFLPEYHKFPQKLYLNRSTVFAVRHATRLISVSESTKKDLITKLGCPPEKVRVVYEAHRFSS